MVIKNICIKHSSKRNISVELSFHVLLGNERLQNLRLWPTFTCMPLPREGSLSCHTCSETGPRFLRYHPKDRPFSRLLWHANVYMILVHPDFPRKLKYCPCNFIIILFKLIQKLNSLLKTKWYFLRQKIKNNAT